MSIDPAKPTRIKSAFTAQEAARRRWSTAGQPNQERTVISGRIMKNGSVLSPYKAVLEYSDGSNTHHPFKTMRAGEAFVRSEAPMPVKEAELRRSPNPYWGPPLA